MDLEKAGKTLVWWLAAALLGVFVYHAATIPTRVEEIVTSRVDVWALDTSSHLSARDKQVEEFIQHWNSFLKEQELNNRLNAETVQTTLREASEIVHYVYWQILPEAKGTITDARVLLQSMQQDVAKAGDGLESLDLALQNTATLVDTLDKAVKDGSPQAMDLLKKTAQSVEDLDKLLTNESIVGSLKNIEGTTENLEDATESVAESLRPLRTGVGKLKWFMNKLLSMVKVSPW